MTMNNGGKAKNMANLFSRVISHVIIQGPIRPFFTTHILTHTCICVFWPKLENPESLYLRQSCVFWPQFTSRLGIEIFLTAGNISQFLPRCGASATAPRVLFIPLNISKVKMMCSENSARYLLRVEFRLANRF